MPLDLSVNGKSPLAAWVPELDTTGRGTTTLNDLAGSYNGTLTNMDAATDWVNDGGWCLDFDGSNDYVDAGTSVGSALGTRNTFGLSIWFYPGSTDNDGIFALGAFNGSAGMFQLAAASTFIFVRFNGGQYDKVVNLPSWFNTWNHVVVSYDGSNVTVTRNGSVASGLGGAYSTSVNYSMSKATLGAYFSSSFTFNGRIGDTRLFTQSLDSSDVAWLYNSGAGRGRFTQSGGKGRLLGGSGLFNGGLIRPAGALIR